jgi:pimeloyl-ACP methyl ester carboxylesterase
VNLVTAAALATDSSEKRGTPPAVEDAIYTFDFHRESLIALIRALDIRRVTLVCQDWGGLFGLTIPMEMANRFEALLVMNTTLPLVATQAAFLFVCTPVVFRVPVGAQSKCRDRATVPFQHISNFGFSMFVSTNSANVGLISGLSAVS